VKCSDIFVFGIIYNYFEQFFTQISPGPPHSTPAFRDVPAELPEASQRAPRDLPERPPRDSTDRIPDFSQDATARIPQSGSHDG